MKERRIPEFYFGERKELIMEHGLQSGIKSFLTDILRRYTRKEQPHGTVIHPSIEIENRDHMVLSRRTPGSIHSDP